MQRPEDAEREQAVARSTVQARNPMFRREEFQAHAVLGEATFSIESTARKTLVLLLIVFAAAGVTWNRYFGGEDVGGLMMIGIFGGLGVVIVSAFKPLWAVFLGPLYAALEGLALGGISAMFHEQWDGLPLLAVEITFAITLVMLTVYATRLIRVTDKMRRGVMIALFGILVAYGATFLLGLFGINVPLFWDNGIMGILVTLVILGVATFCLLIDFDFIEQSAAAGAPKGLEWYAALSLVITIVWIYIELLRLLSIFASDD